MSPMRRISARAAGSALTLRRSISRSTWSSSLRSVTLMTSMSLCSCLITCSMMKASPRTTSVIRDTVGSRVSPTERLSMLYPRAEKSPATRESTPNLFSTSTAMVCLRCSTVLTLEPRLRLGGAVAHLAGGRRQDHVGVGPALAPQSVCAVFDDGGFHRPPLFVARRQLLTVHLEGAVAVDVHHEAAGMAGL